MILSQSGVKRILGTSMPMMPEAHPREKNSGLSTSSDSTDSTAPSTSTTKVSRGTSRATEYSLSPSPPPSLKETNEGVSWIIY